MLAYASAATAVISDMTAELSSRTPDPLRVGELLNQSHSLLRDLVRLFHQPHRRVRQTLLRAGAYGAKLTGSGHGGCCSHSPLEAIGAVLSALRGLPVRVMVFTTGEPHGVVFPPTDL